MPVVVPLPDEIDCIVPTPSFEPSPAAALGLPVKAAAAPPAGFDDEVPPLLSNMSILC